MTIETVGSIIDFGYKPQNNHDLSPRVYQHKPAGLTKVFTAFSRDRFPVENICLRCEYALRGNRGHKGVHVVELSRTRQDISVISTAPDQEILKRTDSSICNEGGTHPTIINIQTRADAYPYKDNSIHPQGMQECPKGKFTPRK